MGQTLATASDRADSLMRWWRDAGVDTWVSEAQRRWMAEPPAVADLVAPIMEAVEAEAPLPASLPAFADWLMTSGDVPDAGPPARRVRPAGQPGGLMILTDMPELADIDAGELLSGEIAELFDAMLAAIGRERESVYIASLCPGRPPSGRIADTSGARLTELARHHVALAAPKQMWLLGSAASRALLGIDDVAAGRNLHRVNLDDATVETIATAHPKLLLNDRERKHRRRMWAAMQLLTGAGDA